MHAGGSSLDLALQVQRVYEVDSLRMLEKMDSGQNRRHQSGQLLNLQN